MVAPAALRQGRSRPEGSRLNGRGARYGQPQEMAETPRPQQATGGGSDSALRPHPVTPQRVYLTAIVEATGPGSRTAGEAGSPRGNRRTGGSEGSARDRPGRRMLGVTAVEMQRAAPASGKSGAGAPPGISANGPSCLRQGSHQRPDVVLHPVHRHRASIWRSAVKSTVMSRTISTGVS